MSLENPNRPIKRTPEELIDTDKALIERIKRELPEHPENDLEKRLPKELDPGKPNHPVFENPRSPIEPQQADTDISPEAAYHKKPPQTL